MIKVTKSDRIFIMIAVPAAVIAAYCWLCAFPVHKEFASMKSRCESLGDEQTLESARVMFSVKLEKAKERLAAALLRAASAPESGMTASAGEDDATRLGAVCNLMRECGGRLSACVPEGAPADETAYDGAMLKRIGVSAPAVWKITVEAPYPVLAKFLEELSARKIPAIPGKVTMTRGADDGKPNFWTLTVCL